MNNLQLFHNEMFGNVRATTINDEPWFVGTDVAEALGYKNGSRDVNRHVDEEDRRMLKSDDLQPQEGEYRNGTFEIPNRGVILINESGVYSLILRSNLPKAKEFKHWVTSEILPSIRKNGFYATDVTIDRIVADPESFIQILTAYADEKKKNRELENLATYQRQEIATLRPKANYVDMVLQCQDLVPITVIAKDFGLSAKGLNKILHDKGVQYKQGGVWVLYQKYANEGYVQSKTYTYDDHRDETHATMHTQWTQKGRLFIYELLKGMNILPTVERNQ